MKFFIFALEKKKKIGGGYGDFGPYRKRWKKVQNIFEPSENLYCFLWLLNKKEAVNEKLINFFLNANL